MILCRRLECTLQAIRKDHLTRPEDISSAVEGSLRRHVHEVPLADSVIVNPSWIVFGMLLGTPHDEPITKLARILRIPANPKKPPEIGRARQVCAVVIDEGGAAGTEESGSHHQPVVARG